MCQWLIAKWYDRIMQDAEDKGLREWRYQWQKRLAWIWRWINDGCRVTRHTEEAIIHAGFEIKSIQRQSMRGVPLIVRPSIRGIAQKP